MTIPLYKSEFPDYPDMPEIADALASCGFEDASWHNDACPAFDFALDKIDHERDQSCYRIWVDYSDPSRREMPATKRFSVCEYDSEFNWVSTLKETDSFDELMKWLADDLFQFKPDDDGVFSFSHRGMSIRNPTISECGRFNTEPSYYGFNVWQTGGGCTAWGRRFNDKYMLVVGAESNSHEIDDTENVGIGVYEQVTSDTLVQYELTHTDLVPGSLNQG